MFRFAWTICYRVRFATRLLILRAKPFSGSYGEPTACVVFVATEDRDGAILRNKPSPFGTCGTATQNELRRTEKSTRTETNCLGHRFPSGDTLPCGRGAGHPANVGTWHADQSQAHAQAKGRTGRFVPPERPAHGTPAIPSEKDVGGNESRGKGRSGGGAAG